MGKMNMVPYFQGFSSLKWTNTSFFDDSPVDLKRQSQVLSLQMPLTQAHAAA